MCSVKQTLVTFSLRLSLSLSISSTLKKEKVGRNLHSYDGINSYVLSAGVGTRKAKIESIERDDLGLAIFVLHIMPDTES